MSKIDLRHGDCLTVMATLPADSVDAVVTDPPYELGFMGKAWDSTGVAFNPDVWREVLRVLKPGGHLLAFSGSRTYHRMAVAIEDAGFEIRDQIMWIYGSGFPKSLDVSKAIDKAAGVERELLGYKKRVDGTSRNYENWKNKSGSVALGDYSDVNGRDSLPATPSAQQWQGWGTALKPAHEPLVLARKPLIGTVAANVLEHGTGALNIDASRILSNDGFEKAWDKPVSTNIGAHKNTYISNGQQHIVDLTANRPFGGRWPANVIHDGSDEVVELFPSSKSNGGTGGGTGGIWATGSKTPVSPGYVDAGSAARFFYSAKASKRDRNEGLDGFEKRQQDESRKEGNPGGDNPRNRGVNKVANHHPTVKPTDLMRYLCRLITPPNGLILDPFTGSGSTGKAAVLEGFDFLGIEMQVEYVEIARARIAHAQSQVDEQLDYQ
jgi:DNA modification methylase